MHTHILRNNLGKRYKLYTDGRGPCASSTVRENLKPLTFNDPVYAKQFIRFLDAPVNLWQTLARQHTTFIRNTDIATQISHLLITGKLWFYELPDTTANTAPLQTQPVQGEGYTTYQFAPTTQLLINDTQPVKEFAQFDTLVRFIDELDIEEKTLQEMNKQLGLYDPLNNHYEASVKYLAEAIYAGTIIVFANDNKIQRQPAELDTYTPTQKPRTLGPEIPAAPIVAPPVEDRKKTDAEQAQALIQASELGAAFCKECEEAKQAQAEASQAPQPMAASPIEDRKGIQPHSLNDAANRLESVSQAIAEKGYQPKYTDTELIEQAQHGDVAKEQYHVRFMEKNYQWAYRATEQSPDNLTGALGQELQGTTGKGPKYWSTTFDQIEDADTDPQLICEKLGLDYEPNKEFVLVIIDTDHAQPLTGVDSIAATFNNVSEFANRELPKEFPKAFTEQTMNSDFQQAYAQHYQHALESGALKDQWSTNTDDFNDYLNTTELSDKEKEQMVQRMAMHNKVGNNQYYEGNGLTKDTNSASPNRYGAVETLNFERKQTNLQMLKEKNAIKIIPLG